MCRFVHYLGEEIGVSQLLIEPSNSLIHRSFHSHERTERLNGDGFGLAWYPPGDGAEPALFRDVTPAWNNANLFNLARVTQSRCVLAHVRAATPGCRSCSSTATPSATGGSPSCTTGKSPALPRFAARCWKGFHRRRSDSSGAPPTPSISLLCSSTSYTG